MVALACSDVAGALEKAAQACSGGASALRMAALSPAAVLPVC